MSTKSTILLTKNEHWYHDMHDDMIHIQLHLESFLPDTEFPIADNVWEFKIRADSELGQKLKKLIGKNL